MGEKKRAIKDWARDDRPREKLLDKGAWTLSDSELVAILLREGTVDQTAIGLARIVLQDSRDNLQELGKKTAQHWLKIKGIGRAKAAILEAALELGRRRQAGLAPERMSIRDSQAAAAYLRPLLADYPHEVFAVLYLSQSGGVKHFAIVSQGGITGTTVDPRLVFKRALEEEAVSIIISHNHPSGSLRPSKADEALTAKMQEGAKYLDIKLLDHIIVGDQGYFSFANEGLLGY
jgi:DNA repair protein RadC